MQTSNGPAAPLANIVRFTNQSARSFSLQDFRTHETSGIAAIQIVNISTDRDSNSIPDSWEIHHGMDATTETDPDLDGLSDWDERMLGPSSGNANSLARPVPHDSTGDGNADSEINGDYAVFLERFANYQSLSAGNGSATPTRTDAARLLMQATFGPTILTEYKNKTMPLPRSLFSHSDQTEQWQTSLPQGDVNLTDWAGRVADILDSTCNLGAKASMSISFAGNNIFQVGKDIQQFVMTNRGALTFSQLSDGNHPTATKNLALRSLMEQEYANMMEKAFAELLLWFGLEGSSNFDAVLPNLRYFYNLANERPFTDQPLNR